MATSMVAEVEALREAYAALNRGDVPSMVAAFDSEIEWTEPDDYPGGGTVRGREAVTAHISKARATWAEGGCEPERFVVAGDKFVAFVYVRVRLQHETAWRGGPQADVYTFRDGKAVAARVFAERREALEWVGADPSEADAMASN